MSGLSKVKSSVTKAATQPKALIYTGEDKPLANGSGLKNTKALGAKQESDKYQSIPKRPELTLKG